MDQYLNILTNAQIEYLSALPGVLAARHEIDQKKTGSVPFTCTEITSDIKTALYTGIGLDLTNVSNVPMRWIKGDLATHIDVGAGEFSNTYLVYLTDSQGEFIIDNISYSISKGTAYVFNEGLEHETINTGTEPRLLLGPMSDQGFAVGRANLSGPGGSTIYIRAY